MLISVLAADSFYFRAERRQRALRRKCDVEEFRVELLPRHSSYESFIAAFQLEAIQIISNKYILTTSLQYISVQSRFLKDFEGIVTLRNECTLLEKDVFLHLTQRKQSRTLLHSCVSH